MIKLSPWSIGLQLTYQLWNQIICNQISQSCLTVRSFQCVAGCWCQRRGKLHDKGICPVLKSICCVYSQHGGRPNTQQLNRTKSLQGRSVLTESAGNRKKTLLGFIVYRFARAYDIFYISVTPCNRKQRTKLDKYYSYDFRHKLLNKSALFILAYLFVWKPVVHISSLYLAQQFFLWSLQDFGAKWPMLYLW